MHNLTKQLLYIIAGLLLLCNVKVEATSYNGTKIGKLTLNKETVKLESIIKAAPWEVGAEPTPLPKNWKKHRARQNIIVYYLGHKVFIPRGDTYFTYKGKVSIGWHGTYNPPCGMYTASSKFA